jgi:hypothetical protein
MKKVAIVGSHGLYANYGGWDQLVRNLAERKSINKFEYLIFNSSDTPDVVNAPKGVKVKKMIVKASGFQGLIYDFWSILMCYNKIDTILLLGVQGIPLIPILSLFKKVKIVSNVGGIEWERPKFGYFSKLYLRFCFNLSFIYSDYVILDNHHYYEFVPKKISSKVKVLTYGGEIDKSLEMNNEITDKYPFLNKPFYLSISRSLEDNQLEELCACFAELQETLVLISNFSKSAYGTSVYEKYKGYKNIILINGLYLKPELDLIRRKCKAYIHTHKLCGTAPSLVEMIIAQVPIISWDNPQNRNTLQNQGYFFSSFDELKKQINSNTELKHLIPSVELVKLYDWNNIVSDYERIL